MIWKTKANPEVLNKRSENTLAEYLDITFTEVGEDYVLAEMPVLQKHKQPIGIMNGGVSCVIAETVGSTAANYAVDLTKQYCVGLDINTNHLRPVSSGVLTAKAFPFHIGKTTQVWSIEIRNDADKLVSINRLTLAVKDH
ncbi:hotdog fold thioesterase [Facilibium subflavum]|uniref:hotdog fold thioesterase n=1 Tax=Facilibium subflavum TaxID=2219058 RepID=UPI001F4803BD|nr:hotdog fold thioesterase [Facilibium subflavum]